MANLTVKSVVVDVPAGLTKTPAESTKPVHEK
jgi:hypothetical protein